MAGQVQDHEDTEISQEEDVLKEFGCFRKRYTEKRHRMSWVKAQGAYQYRRDPSFQIIRKERRDLAISKEKSKAVSQHPLQAGSLRSKALIPTAGTPGRLRSQLKQLSGDSRRYTLCLCLKYLLSTCGTRYLISVGSTKFIFPLSLHRVIPKKQLPNQRLHYPVPFHLRLKDWFTNKMWMQRTGITPKPRELRRGCTFSTLSFHLPIGCRELRGPYRMAEL